eukprot:CAMPEP_0177384428 /NCGR_PEP_ID=MMETSP0368-20130122/49689_1 /TAXON_ID=447022 ORGANISM="Scrippsiella hangoei-like, Strain SHHI-4" /NCGR_SAMPLE_ID=MMETSP0368 /ASSEMBLY_ACC=CAM_ASM_000363 /LENGTH=207 /DNA_ID=CAMNT_0018849097 /DNA_START=268 /DNA_END=887 /DNA_ORIENTATION=+
MSAIARRSSSRAAPAPWLPSRMHELEAVLARPDPVAVDSPLVADGLGHREAGERHETLEVLGACSGGEDARRTLDLDSLGEKDELHGTCEAAAGAAGDEEGVLNSGKPFLIRVAAVWALERRSKGEADCTRDLQNAGAGEPALLGDDLDLRGLGDDRRICHRLSARPAIALASLSSAAAVVEPRTEAQGALVGERSAAIGRRRCLTL